VKKVGGPSPYFKKWGDQTPCTPESYAYGPLSGIKCHRLENMQ
jgi:hypothetical protein